MIVHCLNCGKEVHTFPSRFRIGGEFCQPTKGLTSCRTHYMRRHPDKNPNRPKPKKEATKEERDRRFWSRVNKLTESECWNWTGLLHEDGYGRFCAGAVSGRKGASGAHRYALYLKTGKWPTMCVLHSCDNPRCVNPNHLREGTVRDNFRDAVSRGRTAAGVRNASAKLNPALVQMVRVSQETAKDLARVLGVSPSCVGLARRRHTWKSVGLEHGSAFAQESESPQKGE
jgi:hypothetical protein